MRRLALLLLVILATACARPRTADDVVSGAEAAYDLGCVALEVADAASVAWLAGLDAPTEADVARGEQIVQALETSHAALTRARAALVAGEDALQDVREALAVLRLAASLLGAQAPPGLETALSEAERVIGGAP